MALPLARTSYESDSSGEHRGLILLIVAIGLGLRGYQLSLPGHLFGITEYDDGVYFGAALRLIGGFVPYKDYVLVQPPGIAVLLSPIALLAKAIGTANGLAVARVFTVAVAGANVALVGLLVRSRGKTAITVACGVMAVYPQGIASSQTVLLEPYLNFFCLLALVFCFRSFHFRGSRSAIFVGGIFFGVAGSVKAWAIIPVVVVVILAFVESRASGIGNPFTLILGTGTGFAAFTSPFIALAPREFFHQVVAVQLSRVPGQRVGIETRLSDLTGAGPLVWLFGHLSLVVVVLSLTLVLLFVAALMRVIWRGTTLSVFAVATTALVFLALMWPNDFYYHYAAFEAPFLALTLAVAVSSSAGDRWGELRDGRESVAFPVAAAMLSLFVVLQVAYESVAPAAPLPEKMADLVIPKGACVVSDQVSLLIASNRFYSTSADCPRLLDPFGTALSLSGGRTVDGGAAQTAGVVSYWLSALNRAQYLWLTPQNARRVPWTAVTRSYFNGHFKSVSASGSELGTIYQRSTQKPS